MEPEELDVCSSSSESSDSEESLCSEEIEVDGDKEVILVPRKQKGGPLARVDNDCPVDETTLGGLGFSEFFHSVMQSLASQDLVKRSPMGQHVVAPIHGTLMQLDGRCYASFAVLLVTELNKCLLATGHWELELVLKHPGILTDGGTMLITIGCRKI